MNILLVGCHGNMGRRYSAILNYLGHKFTGIDCEPWPENLREMDKVIIATPTDTHFNIVMDLRERLKPGCDVLCEKPIVKTEAQLERLLHVMEGMNLYMVNQYRYLQSRLLGFDPNWTGKTEYDYYNSGKDGLVWDCIQILALANAEVALSNKSPYWTCRINGDYQTPSEMDGAYVEMIEDFLGPKTRVWGREMILHAHYRVLAYLAAAQY